MSRIASKSISHLTYTTLPPLPRLPGGGVNYEFPNAPGVSYLTTDECARILRVTKETVRLYVSAGKIKAALIGRNYLVRRTDLDAYIASLSEGGPQS